MLLSYNSSTTVFSTIYTAIALKAKPWSSRGKNKSGLKLDLQAECEALDLKKITMSVLCKGYFHAGLKHTHKLKHIGGY